MAVVPHKYIQHRAGFFVALDNAVASSRRLGGAKNSGLCDAPDEAFDHYKPDA